MEDPKYMIDDVVMVEEEIGPDVYMTRIIKIALIVYDDQKELWNYYESHRNLMFTEDEIIKKMYRLDIDYKYHD